MTATSEPHSWQTHRRFGEFDVYYNAYKIGIYLSLADGQAIAIVDRGTWHRHVLVDGAREAATELLGLYGSVYSVHSAPSGVEKTHQAWNTWLRDHEFPDELEG